MQVSDFANFQISLSAVPASQANFGVGMLMVDHADIPIDKRYAIATRSTYATTYTASTAHVNYMTTVWGQNYNPSQFYLGRWVSAASSPYIVFDSHSTTVADYTAISDFYLKISDGTDTDEVGPIDCTSGVTSIADVCTKIQTALQAITTPNITGLDTATCAVDILDRIVITNSTTGASADSISTTTASTGTDLAGSSYWDSGFSQAGLDAEAVGTAAAAVFALDNTPFAVSVSGASIAQAVAFSTAMNALDKVCLLDVYDTDAKDSSATTDIGYQVEALSHQKTWMAYTEHSTANGAAAIQYPSATIMGEVMPRTEGTTNFALTSISGVSESGLGADGTTVLPLTATERSALDAKGYDYLADPAGVTHFINGLAAGGNEMRVMIGKAWMAAKVNEDVYAYMIAQNVVTFSDDDILAIKGIVQKYYDICVDRKLLDEGATITMPAASSFSSAVKAAHTMTLSDIMDADVQSAVNNVVATLSWSV